MKDLLNETNWLNELLPVVVNSKQPQQITNSVNGLKELPDQPLNDLMSERQRRAVCDGHKQ